MNRYRLIFAAVAVCICTSASAQTPLPTPLPEPFDPAETYNAARRQALSEQEFTNNVAQQNRKNAIEEQNRLLNQQVGDALARGNFEEAANIAARAGNIDLYWRIKEMAKR